MVLAAFNLVIPFFSFKSALNHFFDMVRNEKFVNYQGRYEKCVKIIEMI